jgi:hypothetical protein
MPARIEGDVEHLSIQLGGGRDCLDRAQTERRFATGSVGFDDRSRAGDPRSERL